MGKVKGRSPNLSVVIWRSAPRDDVLPRHWSCNWAPAGGHSHGLVPYDEGRAVYPWR